MSALTAKRTLVKSPPELWEELSEVERLAKHLGAFGEITITKLEPEHTVAWEGEHASGTVSIEPSGWGTKVTLRAELPYEEPEPEPEPDPEPEPVPAEPVTEAPPEASTEETEQMAEPAPEPERERERPRRGFWAWLFKTRTGSTVKPEPVAASEPEPEPAPAEPEPEAVPAAVTKPTTEAEAVATAEAERVATGEAAPVTAGEAEPPAGDPPLDHERARLVLDEALDALGAAHHRPFSRG
jgi:hypothetical protein